MDIFKNNRKWEKYNIEWKYVQLFGTQEQSSVKAWEIKTIANFARMLMCYSWILFNSLFFYYDFNIVIEFWLWETKGSNYNIVTFIVFGVSYSSVA
jgi:hypothetical protein